MTADRAPAPAPDANRRVSQPRASTSTRRPRQTRIPSAAPAPCPQRPSADGARCLLNSMGIAGVAITVTPPTSARSHSPERSDLRRQTQCRNDDEHAASTDTARALQTNTYATRPEGPRSASSHAARSAPGRSAALAPYEPWNTRRTRRLQTPQRDWVDARAPTLPRRQQQPLLGIHAGASLGAIPKTRRQNRRHPSKPRRTGYTTCLPRRDRGQVTPPHQPQYRELETASQPCATSSTASPANPPRDGGIPSPPPPPAR